MADDANPRAIIGANNPPPDPFEAHRVHIEDLYTEAKNWCDGAPIETEAQAEEVSRLLDLFREAHDGADASRLEENKPFDEGKAAVQAKYAPLIADTKAIRGKTVLAKAALKQSLTAWLKKQEDARRAAAEAARKEAERVAAAAAAAAREAYSGDLGAMEAAEQLVADAKAADKAASAIENDRARATGGSRAVTLRTTYRPELTDPAAALRHYAATRGADLKAFLVGLAQTDVREGKRTIPGFAIHEEKVAV